MEIKIPDEATKLAPQVYSDLVQPAAKEIGSVSGRTVKMLLAPLRILLWGYEKIEDVVTKGLEERLAKVPNENRKHPDPEIAVPTLQALTYTAQNDTLREMFLNLLANSMDISQERNVHPSYVEIIKQMNVLDAKVFKNLVEINDNIQAISPYAIAKVGIDGNIHEVSPHTLNKHVNKHITNVFPEWYLGWTIENYDFFDLSACIIRLNRLGIIEFMHDRLIEGKKYSNLKKSPYIISTFEKIKKENQQYEFELEFTENYLYVNEFGRRFAKSCIL
jgi:hypothetical protein